ncbi:MAG: methyltransferase domain-containing protein [Vicingus serpentipes]|nr:methyltransferase domain-containing protein [Vicingus serpentipes]
MNKKLLSLIENKEIVFRKDEIIKYCKDKSVLHLGFIQHSEFYEQKIKENDWLHGKIAEVSKKLVGIDYLEKDVNIISEKYGYECYFGDVMDMDGIECSEKFEVIICGELIEHIENPGLMLEGVKRFMDSESILIITTPNPWMDTRIKLIKNGQLEDKWLNKEHVSWFSFETLKQLLDRKKYDITIADYYYGESTNRIIRSDSFINRVKSIAHYFKLILTKKRFYNGLFFVCKKST